MIDKSINDEHVINAIAGECPNCRSLDVDYGVAEFEGEQVSYCFTCNNCGRSYTEWYNLEFSEIKPLSEHIYTAVCDNCKETTVAADQSEDWHELAARLEDSGWYVSDKGDTQYCPMCYEYVGDDCTLRLVDI